MLLVIDKDRHTLKNGFNGAPPATLRSLLMAERGSTVTADVFVVDRRGREVDDSGGITLEIGHAGEYAPAGDFTVTFGSETAAIDSRRLTAGALRTALNELSEITTDGGVDVEERGTGDGSRAFAIIFRSVGTISQSFTSDLGRLVPLSSGTFTATQTGDGSNRHVVIFEIAPQKLAEVASFGDVAVATAAVETEITGDADTRQVETLRLSGEWHGGEWLELDTGGGVVNFPADSTAGRVEDAINGALGAATVDVTKPYDGEWRVAWAAVGVNTSMSATLPGLDARQGQTGTLSFNTTQAVAAMAGRRSVPVRADIKLAGELIYSEEFDLPQSIIPSAAAATASTLITANKIACARTSYPSTSGAAGTSGEICYTTNKFAIHDGTRWIEFLGGTVLT